jgi:hypothetical protein
MGMGWLWLIGALLAAGGAYLAGWPAWSAYRARDARDLNTERYLAWRGRADRTGGGSMREGMTGEERRRLWLAAALGTVAAACLVAFFVAT